MVKRDPKVKKSSICPRCKGNGYFTIKESVENPLDKVVQCPMCNSEGEINDPGDDIIITSNGMHQLQ
jgi:DnaJ-class molecular chaperone|tara:strand:+ start:96 stop:296 length:201 start_codon:yes stop_codon:yes gene_type:complete